MQITDFIFKPEILLFDANVSKQRIEGLIPPSNWSDTSSFATVNGILDPNKMLLLGGEEQQ